MKTRTMSQGMAGVALMLALTIAAGDAEARKAANKKTAGGNSATELAAPARLGREATWDPIRYPEDTNRRQLKSGHRSLWEYVQALSTAPLL